MRIKSALALAAFSVGALALSHAATLANFDFIAGSLNSSTASITGITVSAVSSASSFNSFTSNSGFDSAAQISGAIGFFSDPTAHSATGDALVFTITAASGFSFSLEGFAFIARSTATAPDDIGFKINATSHDFSTSYSNNSTITPISNQALALTGLTSATISIQGWNSTGSGELQLDDLVATGQAVPEPSAALLGTFFVALMLLRRRR